MKHYTYETVTGSVTIEVDESWHKLLTDEDIAELNNNRRHTRADHKYAPGEPLAFECLEYDGKWFVDHNDAIAPIELLVDLEQALKTLTDVQRRYFVMVRLKGYSYAEIARRECKADTSVMRVVNTADTKIKNFFG